MAKTPVSIVQEYCTKQQILPKYDLIINGVGTHDPYFKYRLTVNETITYGDGKSKKEAKHEAARIAITELHISEGVNPVVATNTYAGAGAQSKANVENVPSPYEGAVKENSIGVLATICSTNMLPEPQYMLIGEVGPPHAKEFTFECSVGNLKEIAASRTKQQAKHISAIKMLERLKSVIGPEILEVEKNAFVTSQSEEKQTIDNQADQIAQDSFMECKAKMKKLNENFNLACSDYHILNFKVIFNDSPYLEQLAVYNEDTYNTTCDPFKLLDPLFESASRRVVFTFVPAVKQSYSCFCEMEASPFFVTWANGRSETDAKAKAAHKMLLFLKTFL